MEHLFRMDDYHIPHKILDYRPQGKRRLGNAGMTPELTGWFKPRH